MEKTLENDNYEIDFIPNSLWINACISVIGETLDQLNILRKINKMPELTPLFESYRTVEERFSKYAVPTIKEQSMTTEQRNLLTFQKNLAIVETALKTTYEEFQKSGLFNTLLDVVRVHENLKSDEENLREDTRRKQNEYKELKTTVFEEKIYFHRKCENVMMDIGRTKDDIRNFTIESEVKTRFVKEWQNSKIQQLDIALQRKEENATCRLRNVEGDIFKDMRINEEILLALDEMQKDLERQIEMWTEKYNIGVKELDEKIEELKEKKEAQREKTDNLKAIYAERQGHIDDYKRYKIEQERKKEELKGLNIAATNIQAWWRGVMVRMGFGRFRKKKDKKGKKGSSEKKDKK